jgi:hypothetical protein
MALAFKNERRKLSIPVGEWLSLFANGCEEWSLFIRTLLSVSLGIAQLVTLASLENRLLPYSWPFGLASITQSLFINRSLQLEITGHQVGECLW